LFCIPASLWILDEPFTAIDQRGVTEIERWLKEFVSAGGAVLLTTHHRLSFAQDFKIVTLGEAANV
jgi:heme exporter protein A